MAIRVAAPFFIELLGDGVSSSATLDLNTIPVYMPEGMIAQFLTKAWPIGTISLFASGKENGLPVFGISSSSMSGSTLSLTLSFTPDANTKVAFSGKFLY